MIPAGQIADNDLLVAVNALLAHPNTAPFISKQLIQHLVTSNPSPAFVQRIAAEFASCTNKYSANPATCPGGAAIGTPGDMKSVIKAILLDPKSLAPRNPVTSQFGKLKEPVLLVTNMLRAMTATSDGVYPLLQTPNMDQNVYTSPTVFNYYPADYVIPGTTLAGPQFGIFNATTYFPRANFMYNLSLGDKLYGGRTTAGQHHLRTQPRRHGQELDGHEDRLWPADAVRQQHEKSDPSGRQRAAVRHDAGRDEARDQERDRYPGARLPGSGPYTAQQFLDRARTAVYLVTVSPKYQLEF